MGAMRAMMASVALAFLGVAADAFVSPSAAFFARATPAAGGARRGPGATARAAGAMRSRTTMSVIDVRGERRRLRLLARRSVGMCACYPSALRVFCVCFLASR